MTLIKKNLLQAAGHFPNLPMLAASMALGNMTHAISMFSDGKGGLQRFTTKKHLLKIYGMVRHLLFLCKRAWLSTKLRKCEKKKTQ